MIFLENKKIKNEIIKDFYKIIGFDYRGFDYTVMNNKGNYYSVKKKLTPYQLFRHLKGEIIISLPIFEHNQMYVIDIDKRNQKKIKIETVVDNLVNLLGNPFYIEKSYLSGGYHLYFYFCDYINKNSWKNLENYFKENNLGIIESIYDKKRIKIPYSKYYQIAGTYDKLIKNRISIIKNFYSLYNIFKNKQKINIPDILKNNYDEIKLKSSFNNNTNKNFCYGNGNRYKTQLKIAFNIIKNKGNFKDFVNSCYYWNDGTSKDMKLDKTNVIKMLKKTWKYAKKNFNSIYNNININNINNITKIKINYFKLNKEQKEKLYDFFLKEYKNYKENYKEGGKIEKKFINDLIKIFEIFIDIKKFREENDRKYDEKFKFLNNGIPFGIELQKKIAKKFSISNIKDKMNFLKKINFIESLKDTKGYDYSYKKTRFVKHYVINPNWISILLFL